MDPPSPQLVQRLTSLALCRTRDLRRCRSRVRRLARDLPTFDSVWIDALVQERRLTIYQAQILGSNHPDALEVGSCVLTERLGDDGRFVLFRARQRPDRNARLLSFLTLHQDDASAAGERLRGLIDALDRVAHPGLAIPTGFTCRPDALVIISPWGGGSSLRDLLVRRGRFPHRVVRALAVQVCDALVPLAERGMAHGDIRLRNICLAQRGRAVLLHPAILPALGHDFSIHAQLAPDCYDGVAPELIGVARTIDTRCDAYALGCVLWETLAGRPPFPQNDPLTKLAARQTHALPDVRAWAPDVPDDLAAIITELTELDPAQRSCDFARLRDRLRMRPRAARRGLASFSARCRLPAGPHRPETIRRRASHRPLLAGMALLAITGFGLLDTRTRAHLLDFAASLPSRVSQHAPSLAADETAPTAPSTAPNHPLSPLPPQAGPGLVTLDSDTIYAAGEIAAVGPLTLRSSGERRAVIVVDEHPLRLWAERVVLDNIELRYLPRGDVPVSATPGETRSPLVVVDAQHLALRRCACRLPERAPDAAPAAAPAIVWNPLDAAAATEQRLIVAKCFFPGDGAAVQPASVPSHMQFDNVLKLGSGPLIDLPASDRKSPRPLAVSARRVTLRGACSLVRLATREGASLPPLHVTLEDDAFDFAPGRAALLEFAGTAAPRNWQRLVQITGEGSLVPAEAALAALRDPASQQLAALDVSQVDLEGLMTSEFIFAGPPDPEHPETSVLVSPTGYGRSTQPPGIASADFAAPMSPVRARTILQAGHTEPATATAPASTSLEPSH